MELDSDAFRYVVRDSTTQMANDTSETDDISRYDEYTKATVRTLWLVFPPIIVFVGTIGNIFCFLVTRRKSLRKSSVGLCLSVLALADLMVLWTGITRNWSKELFRWDVRNVHESLCKLHRIFLYFGLDYSAWVLVTVTMERFVSVCYPFKSARICSLKTTRKILIFIAVFICVENLGVLIVKGKETIVDTKNNKTFVIECGYTSESGEYYWKTVRPWNVIALYAIIPFALMIFFGIRIIVRLYKAKKSMKAIEKYKRSNSDAKPLQPNANSGSNNYHQAALHNNHVQVAQQAQQMNLASVKMHSVTVMTVVIACVFLVLVTPSHLEFFLEKYWDKTDAHDYAVFRLIESSSRTLLYTYHACPFFVYMASGHQFRQEFFALLRRQKSAPGYTQYALSSNGKTSATCSPATDRRVNISSVAGSSQHSVATNGV